ncbi:MAG: hypothetical protein IJQ45_00995 [Clostridia bacterium]|nr:hypothetical protein [Clostridia bacterium]MBR0205298.1 hypothetical protein [Clostridia bacterium]
MRNERYYAGILGALGVGEDNGVPDPAWRHEEYLKAIYDALRNTPKLPPATQEDNGKVAMIVDGVWSKVTIPAANGVSF